MKYGLKWSAIVAFVGQFVKQVSLTCISYFHKNDLHVSICPVFPGLSFAGLGFFVDYLLCVATYPSVRIMPTHPDHQGKPLNR